MRYVTAGESHGRALTAIISDVPAGIPIDQAMIDHDLARRQVGYGRGGRMRIERDRALISAGVRLGSTIGSPIALTVANRDWDNWTDVMQAAPGHLREEARVKAPRPGHADLAGIMKTGTRDVRDILERASARETAARVAAGAVARAFLRQLGVEVHSFVASVGEVSIQAPLNPELIDHKVVEGSDLRCPDAEASGRMRVAIDQAQAVGESLGGTFYVTATGLVPGLGGYAQADQRLDARLAAAVISIPAIKGVEFGTGFASAGQVGSQVHDEIYHNATRGYHRLTNHAGGLEGGMTNGQPLVVRAAMKPIPTLMTPLASVDIDSHAIVDASKERSDVCAVPAAAVVAEAEVCLVLAAAHIEAFGGNNLMDIQVAQHAYLQRLESW